MKKICKLCYREVEEDLMRKDYCLTCIRMLGKGAGYSDQMNEEEANKWLEGVSERKAKLREKGKL